MGSKVSVLHNIRKHIQRNISLRFFSMSKTKYKLKSRNITLIPPITELGSSPRSTCMELCHGIKAAAQDIFFKNVMVRYPGAWFRHQKFVLFIEFPKRSIVHRQDRLIHLNTNKLWHIYNNYWQDILCIGIDVRCNEF